MSDWEQVENARVQLRAAIEDRRVGCDFDDVLNICQDLLQLIEKLNDRDAPQ